MLLLAKMTSFPGKREEEGSQSSRITCVKPNMQQQARDAVERCLVWLLYSFPTKTNGHMRGGPKTITQRVDGSLTVPVTRSLNSVSLCWNPSFHRATFPVGESVLCLFQLPVTFSIPENRLWPSSFQGQ